jgi:hypothetical protein
MKKVLKFIKTIFTIVKDWIVANGIEGVLGLIAGLILWCICYKKLGFSQKLGKRFIR